MADIVSFKPKTPEPDQIWTCTHCGCQTFRLYIDGSSECAHCNVRSDDSQKTGGWVEQLQPDPDFVNDKPSIYQVDTGSVSFAREHTIRYVGPDTSVIVVVQKNGAMRAWADVDGTSSPEEREWLRTVLTVAGRLLLDQPLDSDAPARPEA